jgi:hypothetical protein
LKRIVAALPIAGILAATAATWWLAGEPAVRQERPPRAVEEVVKKRVANVLYEPRLAKFRAVKYLPQSRVGCGEVVARNSTGEDVQTVFVAYDSGFVRFSTEMSPADAVKLVRQSCPDPELLKRAEELALRN